VPDHMHAYVSVWAMKHGLHTYCQKPLCKTVHEARVMAKVAAETKVVTQMGTQSSAEARNLRTVEVIQSGWWARSRRSTWRRIAPSGRKDSTVCPEKIRSPPTWIGTCGSAPRDAALQEPLSAGAPRLQPPAEKRHQLDFAVAVSVRFAVAWLPPFRMARFTDFAAARWAISLRIR